MTRRAVSTRTELPATVPLLVVAYAAVTRSGGKATVRPSGGSSSSIKPGDRETAETPK